MKKLLTIGLLALTSSVFAQSTSTASVSANIMVPIMIANTNNMYFGNIAVTAAAGGTVVLTTSSTRSTTGSVTLPSVTALVQSASYTITGQPSFTYAITLNSTSTVDDGAGHTMTVDAINSLPATTGTLSSTTGTQSLFVGATLNVNANQFPGLYLNNSGISCTVNYN